MNDSIFAELASQATEIVNDELKRIDRKYDFEVRVYSNVRTVGVQGDARTYGYPVEVEFQYNGTVSWDPEFLSRLSTRITNEVDGIVIDGEIICVNRVVYVISNSSQDKFLRLKSL